ncbi:MAG: DUF6198 family protein [Butyrivibrio sp.]|nr:DUF6198 family protein [Butyrivibrio sp.]
MKRYIALFIGFFIMALGVALSTRADLGTSPISCPPYVLSLVIPFTMGAITIAMHVVFILIQILLLRREYDPIQLLQLVAAFVFGFFTDLTLSMTAAVVLHSYFMQWVLCLISCVLVAIGVELEVRAGVVMLAGEGTMTAISKVFHLEFAKVKIAFDLSMVVIACVISFAALGQIKGVREGTVAAAVLVGLMVRVLDKILNGFFNRIGLTSLNATAQDKETEKTTEAQSA